MGEVVVLDVDEQLDLMRQNRAFNRATFDDLSRSLPDSFPSGDASYLDFIGHVQGYLEAPLRAGHLIDRLILSRRSAGKGRDTESVHFLMTLLSLALETETLEDRARSLFLMLSSASGESSGNGPATVDLKATARLIEDLHSTHQVPVEKKVIKTDHSYPTQTYTEATPAQLLDAAVAELKLGAGLRLSEDNFVDVLLSKSVCAWGGCYPRAR